MASILEIILKTIKQGTGFGDTEKEANKLKGTLDGVNKVLAVAGLAVGAKELFDFGKAAVEANRVQKDAINTLEAAAEGVADYTEAMRLAQQETRGMASKTQLASSLGVIFGAGLASNAEQASELANAGAILSSVFASAGASQELYVRLLSSGSIQLFNNFGITQQMVAAKQAEIEATTSLTGGEARLAAVKQALIDNANKYKSALSEDTIAAARFSAATDDLQAALGALLLPQVTESMQNFGIAARGATEGMSALHPSVSGAVQGFIDLANPLTIVNSLIRDYQQLTGQAADAAASTARAQQASAAGALQEARALSVAADSHEELGEKVDEGQLKLRKLKETMPEVGVALSENRIKARDLAETYGLLGQVADQTAAQIESLARAKEQANQGQLDLRAAKEAAPELGARITKNRAAVFEMAQDKEEAEQKASEKAAKQFTSSFEKAADDIGNTISGKLQTTFQEVFKLPEGTADQADEPARRLATVAASGFGSEWLTQLNAQFAGQDFWKPMTAAMQSGNGEQLQAAATGILQQFSQGLITNLFDVNVIRGQVRAEMVQKRLKEQLIEEVKAGLGTEGISQAIGVVEVAAGNVGVATAQTETNVSTMAATAATAGGEIKASFDAPLTSVNTLILRIAELNKMLERTKVLAGEAGAAIGSLNPPVPGANGSGVPNGAQVKMGGPAGL